MAFYTSIGKRLYSKLDLWILKFQYIFNMNMSEFFFKTENLNDNICMSRTIIPHNRVWNSNTISHNISDVTLGSYNYTNPHPDIDGILPKGPYPPCLRMADRALLAGYHRYQCVKHSHSSCLYQHLVRLSSAINYTFTINLYNWK